MEEIATNNLEYQPLQVLWCRLCAHAQKTISLAPIHSFTKQILPSMYQELLSWSRLISAITRVFCMRLTNSPFHQKYFRRLWFFFLSFSSHTFSWACGSLREPRKCFSFCAFTCLLITHSFVNGFQPNLYQPFSHVCSTCRNIFSLK